MKKLYNCALENHYLREECFDDVFRFKWISLYSETKQNKVEMVIPTNYMQGPVWISPHSCICWYKGAWSRACGRKFGLKHLHSYAKWNKTTHPWRQTLQKKKPRMTTVLFSAEIALNLWSTAASIKKRFFLKWKYYGLWRKAGLKKFKLININPNDWPAISWEKLKK